MDTPGLPATLFIDARGQLIHAQLGEISRAELRASFAVLHRCDRESKSSRMPKERVLERAILKLTAQKGVAP